VQTGVSAEHDFVEGRSPTQQKKNREKNNQVKKKNCPWELRKVIGRVEVGKEGGNRKVGKKGREG